MGGCRIHRSVEFSVPTGLLGQLLAELLRAPQRRVQSEPCGGLNRSGSREKREKLQEHERVEKTGLVEWSKSAFGGRRMTLGEGVPTAHPSDSERQLATPK